MKYLERVSKKTGKQFYHHSSEERSNWLSYYESQLNWKFVKVFITDQACQTDQMGNVHLYN